MTCDLWPTVEDGCFGGCTIPADTDPDLLAQVSAQAGTILTILSGNRVGTCETVVRPLSECWTCRGVCSCAAGDRIRLYSPDGPVTEVTQVTVDGNIINPDEYRFYPSGQILYRVPPDVWPRRDLKWADCDNSDTMCVSVVVGYPPDAWALAVHAELACELLQACTGGKCRLPRNATQVSGQGVSVTLSPTELKQFIPSVAGWVAAINPHNASQRSKVWSPDLYPGIGADGNSASPVRDLGWGRFW